MQFKKMVVCICPRLPAFVPPIGQQLKKMVACNLRRWLCVYALVLDRFCYRLSSSKTNKVVCIWFRLAPFENKQVYVETHWGGRPCSARLHGTPRQCSDLVFTGHQPTNRLLGFRKGDRGMLDPFWWRSLCGSSIGTHHGSSRFAR